MSSAKSEDLKEEIESSDDEEVVQDPSNPQTAAKKKRKKKKKASGPPPGECPLGSKWQHYFERRKKLTVDEHLTSLLPASASTAPSSASESSSSSVSPSSASVLHPANKQNCPPTIPVRKLWEDSGLNADLFPHGQIMDYNTQRTTSEELRERDRLQSQISLAEAREAAEVHRQVRTDFTRWLRPGKTLMDCANYIESGTRRLLGVPDNYEQNTEPLKRGWAFPTGLSINDCAAHFSPNPADKTLVVTADDVMKVDFGTHINGRIIDCAFTVCFQERFTPLLRAVQEATEAGIRAAGIDVRMCDIGEAIQEVMESHEVEINGKVHRVKSIKNLNGHSIDRYKIHAGKSVPIVRNSDNAKMEEGEFYAIETFGSTGRGMVIEDGDCSHYMMDFDVDVGRAMQSLRTPAAKSLLKHIDKRFSTLAFCRRWLEGLYTEFATHISHSHTSRLQTKARAII